MLPPSEPHTPPESPSSAGAVVDAVRKDKLRAALFDEPQKERRLGRYRVLGTLGRGGMGTVLEAVDDALERRVALKLLHHDVPVRDQGRLLREARALARLSHPNVVQVHEVGEHPRPFIAMELVRGRTLAQWQRDAPPWRACVRAYLQAGRGLAAVHAQRLVHRDFKPSNCVIDDEGRVRVMDFGLARSLGPGAPSEEVRVGSGQAADDAADQEVSLTDSGTVLGTLAYMPLEQLQGKEADARSDQFSFCVSLYEAVYGERPFEGSSTTALISSMTAEQTRPAPRGTTVPAKLRRVLLRGLSSDPAQRWPGMHVLLEALERLVRPRWRGRVALATVVGGLALAGGSVWREITLRQACVGVADQLAEVWDPVRREQLRETLLGTALPYAPSAWEGVQPRLDAYAEAWTNASREVCEEARIRQEQPDSVVALRTACLHERKVALRETVDVLTGADPATVERAVGLVSQLPGLERCHDVPVLLAEVPPPEDPEVAAQVQALRDELIEARALRIGARYAESLAVIERVVQVAEGIDYPPLQAEVQLGRGWAIYSLGKHPEAVSAFEDAYAGAVAQGHDAVATQAAAMLSFIVGERQSKHEVGLKWAVTARAHALRPAAEPEAEALALSNEAAVHIQRGDFELARTSYERALAIQEQAFGPDDVRLAFTLNGLGIAHTSLDEIDRAAAYHQRAYELRRDNLGPEHPYVAMSLNNLGVVAERQGHHEQALAHVREALAIKERILGLDHPELVSSLINVASLLHRARSNDEARVILERAIAILERLDGPRSWQLGPALHTLGVIQRAQRQLPEARATLLRSLGIKEQAHGVDNPELILPLIILGQVERDLGDHDAGLRYVDRAQAIAERSLPLDGRLRGDPLLMRGAIELARGHAAEAVVLAEQALRQWELAHAPAYLLSEARLLWSKALVASDPSQRARALHLAEQARASVEADAEPESEQLRGEVDEWLAELRRRDPPR
jgi:eukaryotic-like serine/threonine-protein kinase